MEEKIDLFRGKYFFLSNFYVGSDGFCVEKEFQAHKTTNNEDIKLILNAKTPGEAKKLGNNIIMRKDWIDIKFSVMEKLVRQKFSKEPLCSMLIETGDAELIEGNKWYDTFWGICKGKGENHLGRILMKIRSEMKENNR